VVLQRENSTEVVIPSPLTIRITITTTVCYSSVSDSAVTAYCAEGRTVISARTSHIAIPVWVKCRVNCLHVQMLIVGNFRDNRHGEGRALCKWVCVITFN